MLGTSNTHETNGKLIDWQKGVGYTDASTIGYPIRSVPVHCVAVTSHKTGHREFFFYSGRQIFGTDAVEFHYTSANGFKLIIFDD